MLILNKSLIVIDQLCDYIPFVSIISNSIDLLARNIILNKMSQATISAYPYFKHIQDKSSYRCITSMIPVIGNICLIFFDIIIKPLCLATETLPFFACDDKDFVLAALNNDSYALRNASERLQDDKEVIFAALKRSGNNLRFASYRLQDDKEVVLAAVNNHYYHTDYAIAKFKDDKHFFLAAITTNSSIFPCSTSKLWDDETYVLGALKYDKHDPSRSLFRFASERVKYDRNIVLAAVKIKGQSLQYTSDELRNDKEIALTAVKQNSKALNFISPNLWDDENFVFGVLKYDDSDPSTSLLNNASDKVKGNKDVVLKAVKIKGQSLQYASDELRNDPEIALAAVIQNGLAFEYAGKNLKSDFDFVFDAIKKSTHASILNFSCDEIKKNKEMILQVVKENGQALKFVDKSLQDDKEIALAAVKQDAFALSFVSARLKNDKNVLSQAILQNPKILKEHCLYLNINWEEALDHLTTELAKRHRDTIYFREFKAAISGIPKEDYDSIIDGAMQKDLKNQIPLHDINFGFSSNIDSPKLDVDEWLNTPD